MADPATTRRARMEGWYWRIVEPAGGRVVVALCGVCRPQRGAPWAVVALAAHPGGTVRWGVVDGAAGDERGFGAWASPLLRGTDRELHVAVGGDTLEVELRDPAGAERPSLGPAHGLPGLSQYWHAHLLDARVSGRATIGGRVLPLDGARAYAEKNWGPAFAPDWWWGQGFPDDGVTVAFAGGRMGPLAPTAAVLRIGAAVHRLVAPLAWVHAEVAPGEWRLRARGPRVRLLLEGDAAPGAAHLLPVPDVEARGCRLRSRQHLAGRMQVTVREGRRLSFRGSTELAGLERGLPPSVPPA